MVFFLDAPTLLLYTLTQQGLLLTSHLRYHFMIDIQIVVSIASVLFPCLCSSLQNLIQYRLSHYSTSSQLRDFNDCWTKRTMSDTSNVLSIIAISIGGFSTIGLCCLGQKPFIDFIFECIRNMRWSRLFQRWHNEMIYNEIVKNREYGKPQKSTDEALLRVLYNWNPTSPTMPTLCDAIRARCSEIFPIDLICKCGNTIDIGVEYYHAWEAIYLSTKRCVVVDVHEYIPHLKKTVSKLIKDVSTIVTKFPAFTVNIDTTLPVDKTNHEMATFKENTIAEQYKRLETSMKQSHEGKLLDIFGCILHLLDKLINIRHDVEEQNENEQNELFDIKTQIRIKRTIYTNFVDEAKVKLFFRFPTPSYEKEVKWIFKEDI